jgi:2-polyprenyl-3-methyl-5-hydroxy-6-metoxy-1,4-benzoquinol methylase
MDLAEVNFEIKNRHPWETARLKVISHLINKYNNKKCPSILDIGSGDAYAANQFTKLVGHNAKAFCVDIAYTSNLIDKIEKKYGNPHLQLASSLQKINPEKDKMDIVTLLDVIEHVKDDSALINEICEKDYINANTYFFITVPAYQLLYSEHDVQLKHYRRYNQKALKKTLEKCNLEFIEGGYFFSLLLLPRLKQVLREFFSKSKTHTPPNLGQWQKGNFMTRLIHSVLVFDFSINHFVKHFGINLPGLSTYVIAKKKK